MKKLASAAAAALALGFAAGPLHAQDDDALPYCEEKGVGWGVAPTLIAAPGGEKLGVRGLLTGCLDGHVRHAALVPFGTGNAFPSSWALRLDVDVLAAASSLRMPEASSVTVAGGWSISLFDPEEEAPDSIPFAELPDWDGGGFDLGFLDLGASVGYESSVDWEEQYLAAGLQARYAINAAGWGRLLPSVVARFDLVEPARSEARDDRGLSGDAHRRWSLRGYWNTDLGFVAGALTHLRVGADLAMYRTDGLEEALVADGWNAGEWATFTLQLTRRLGLVGPISVKSVYARYSAGRWPTAGRENDALTGGVVLGVGGS